MEAFKHFMIRESHWPPEVYAEIIPASGDVGIRVLMERCLRILDKKGMPADWATSVAITIFAGIGDIMMYGMHRGVKLLKDVMKIVEKVLVKRFILFVTTDDMQFGFMPGKDTIDLVIVVRRIQEQYLARQKKLYMCIVGLEKALDRVPRKVLEWAMRYKLIPEAFVRAVVSLYEGVRTKVKVGTHPSEEFDGNVGVHQGIALLPLLFAIVIDVVMNDKKVST